MTAVEIQQIYLDRCRALLASPAADDLPAAGRTEAEALFAAWQETLDQLADRPDGCSPTGSTGWPSWR